MLFTDAQDAGSDYFRTEIKAQRGGCLYPANAQGDDVVLYSDASRNKPMQKLHFCRQQNKKTANLLTSVWRTI